MKNLITDSMTNTSSKFYGYIIIYLKAVHMQQKMGKKKKKEKQKKIKIKKYCELCFEISFLYEILSSSHLGR